MATTVRAAIRAICPGHALLIRAVCSPRGAGQVRACSSGWPGSWGGQGGGAVMMDASGAPDWAPRMQARRPIMWLGFMTVPGGWWSAAGRLSGAVPQLAGAGADTTRDHPQNSPREKSQKSGCALPAAGRGLSRGRSVMSSDLTQAGVPACVRAEDPALPRKRPGVVRMVSVGLGIGTCCQSPSRRVREAASGQRGPLRFAALRGGRPTVATHHRRAIRRFLSCPAVQRVREVRMILGSACRANGLAALGLRAGSAGPGRWPSDDTAAGSHS
jgi:hypothetical protein